MMRTEIQAIAQIDRMVHEPARLAIMAVLSACESADFKALQHLTGLSKGNLSAQLSKLESAGYVKIDKGFAGRYPHTECALSAMGREAFRAYWRQYQALSSLLATD